MSVIITVTNSGVSPEPVVEYLADSNTKVIKDDLLNAYGAGILKQGVYGVATDTLSAADYNYCVTMPRKFLLTSSLYCLVIMFLLYCLFVFAPHMNCFFL